MNALVFFFLPVFSSSISAMPFISVRCLRSSENAQWKGLLHQVAVYGKDKRHLLSVGGPKLGLSKAEIKQIRGATGFVQCEGSDSAHIVIASAALVGDGSHLITTAHTFQDAKTMKYREPLNACFFQNQDTPPQRVNLDLSQNDKSKLVMGASFPSDNGDYAVAKLAKKIVGVKPFPVDLGMRPLKENEQTILVSATMDDFPVPGMREPIVQQCPIRGVGIDSTTVLMNSCDTDYGASGSVHLVRAKDGQLVIKAMVVSGENNGGKVSEYSYLGGHYTTSVGVDGDFLGAVLALDPSIKSGQGGVELGN